nr:MAG TPA: hypothetical protein [Caudoviricetes sp.]
MDILQSYNTPISDISQAFLKIFLLKTDILFSG